jgi:hypothetical protein
MKLYAGKWFVALRLKDDRTFGMGRPSQAFLANADPSRPSRGI